MNIKGVFLFSLHLSPETFLILRRTERDMIMLSTRYSCQTLRCAIPVVYVTNGREENIVKQHN